MKKVNVAIVGATGAVGVTIREILEERDFPVENLYLLASERSAGERVMFKGKSIRVENLADFDFSKADIGLFSAGGDISAEYAPKAAEAGCVVVDNTSHFRYDDDIPLVVAEVNPERIADYKNRGIIANPNCSTMQLLVALKPIQDDVGIEHINVCTYQAVSGSGHKAVEELASQTAQLLNGREATNKVYDKQIAFNVLPNIDKVQDNGYTKEEMKMVWETHKIFEDPSIGVSPTAVRVPVFYGHSEAVHIKTRVPLDVEQARYLLKNAPGVTVVDDMSKLDYATPVTHASGKDDVFVSRIRKDVGMENGLAMWIVSDNVRKGAALNTVQIAEILVKNYL
ncbi:aspartate-semialdehyde dehydrogenase [Kangiella profundi]|uniref:Aspartate-semialdehyde dehydrogenase n=1 Tax=Kangiella profundi TaxID=1561924 RepID=A0A2K9ARG0_9GAMM|nr:aspartate-semialdehyde dehydrogenase [Kangiella profundi]AUD79003.1 aspartate-semialdehyde dehydrogenase [Kangiella profundi]GGF02310.1 aspartate-semialdehyde dehydrogenase [Kangiella profundi]